MTKSPTHKVEFAQKIIVGVRLYLGASSQSGMGMLDEIPGSRIEVLTSMEALFKDEQGLQFFKVCLTSQVVRSFLF